MAEKTKLPKVDKDACIGCGACANLADEIFFMDSDGKASVKPNLEDEDIEKNSSQIEDAKNSCPVNAIST